MNSTVCLLLNAASTWAMVGLIWLIQIVHYPLFANVGEEQFRLYTLEHQRLITYVVLPLMFIELGTSVLLWTHRPFEISDAMIGVGIALVVTIWLSTFLLQVPQHGALTAGFDPVVHQKLVLGNWIRTIAWTLRGALVSVMLWRALSAI